MELRLRTTALGVITLTVLALAHGGAINYRPASGQLRVSEEQGDCGG